MRAKLLPRFVKKNDRTVNRDDDYAVYFSDTGRQRYWLDGFKGHDVHVERLAVSVSDNMQTGKSLVSSRLGMESQTVHYKKYGKIISESISLTPLTIRCILLMAILCP
ncbi:hypothetical protein AAG778_001679 [Raoultella planticola]